MRTIAFDELESFSQDNTMRGLRSSTQMSGAIVSRLRTDSPGDIFWLLMIHWKFSCFLNASEDVQNIKSEFHTFTSLASRRFELLMKEPNSRELSSPPKSHFNPYDTMKRWGVWIGMRLHPSCSSYLVDGTILWKDELDLSGLSSGLARLGISGIIRLFGSQSMISIFGKVWANLRALWMDDRVWSILPPNAPSMQKIGGKSHSFLYFCSINLIPK